MKTLTTSALALLLSAGVSQATVLNFDDLTTSTGIASISDAYGFTWTRSSVIHRSHQPGTGYVNGMTSGDYVLYNDGGYDASFSSDTDFLLTSLQATSAWDDGNVLTITGYLDGVSVGTSTTTLVTSGPQLITFGWTVDEVRLSTSDNQYAIDDLTINESATSPVPLPATGLLLVGAFGLAGLAKRRGKAA